MKTKHLLLILLLPLLFSANAFPELSQYDANAPLGFAKGVTGGAGGSCVTVSSSSELKSALEKSGKLQIYVKGAIEFTALMKIKNVSDKTLYGLPGSYLFSNKQDASTSGILYFSSANNLIMRNMTFKGPGAYDCDGNDHLCLDKCTNIWIDHCDFQDGVDGNFDCKNASDNICVSWCRFRYLLAPKAGGSGGSNDHRYTNLWGSSDSATGDRGKLKTTFVCCWWDNGCVERMPRVRFGQVHLVNCLWSSKNTSYCVGLGQEAMVYVEKCAFINVQDPLKDYCKEKKSAGKLVDCYQSNVKVKNGSNSAIRNCTFNPATYYTNNLAKMSGAEVQNVVSNANTGAGATLEVTACGGVDGTVNNGGSNNGNNGNNNGSDNNGGNNNGGNNGGSTTPSFTEAPTITKHGSGSATQTINLGESIAAFNYTYTNATDVTVEGMPEGISITKSEGKVEFEGTPTASGTFEFTVKTVGGISEIAKKGTITVVADATEVVNTDAESISVVPTTVSNYFTVRGCENPDVSIFSIAGINVLHTFGNTIDCSSLKSGLYLVRINGSVTTKILKE